LLRVLLKLDAKADANIDVEYDAIRLEKLRVASSFLLSIPVQA